MFSEKKDKNVVEPGTGQNRINEGTKLVGDIHSSGFFRIDGHIEGNVNTPSKVVLGKTGFIKGTLTCENADIEGKFEGNLDVSGTLSLKSTAHIDGEVVVGKLAVEPGATFNASCTMKGGAKNKVNQTATPNESTAGSNHFDRQQRAKKAAEPSK
ncbi:bactofilin family protein [Ulvibacter antarcticus]|uniref:Cytoskeletal protein CcmA (Bactofilin family) n=1 Tax=Ulvibacter antarcticus TaxID=442714 RepID=A0A3L9Z6C4_9FLAO|nr:polymer-forming cytoskeletal protein [Ulvibacter antarcticus]RMA65958.1 cytoskeletal protein CcmA (bactofilin family) [Ulvibacter antarcticus]